MEDKKIFKVFDNFAIAEALDAIALGLPIPAKIQKTFELQPDNFIIWKKLVALSAVIPSGGSALQSVQLLITPAQVKVLNSVPVMLIAAPAGGLGIEIVSATAQVVNFLASFYSSSDISLTSNGIGNPQKTSPIAFLSNPGLAASKLFPVATLNNFSDGAPMFVQAYADSPVLTGGNLIVNALYRIIPAF
jgi:hypothetical protein